MLEIKPVKSYKLPKYPQGLYYSPPENYPWNLISTSVASIALVALLGCSSNTGNNGIVGPPPMLLSNMTEREARTIISQAFAKYGVTFEEDVPSSFSVKGQPFTVNLDGFNKELNIGYEYVSDIDGYQAFFDKAGPGPWIAGVTTDINDPSVLVINNVIEGTGDKEYLENAVEDFVNELRSHGIL